MNPRITKKQFRAGVPEHVPPLRPQTAKRRPQNDIILEEIPESKSNGTKLKANFSAQRPTTAIRNKAPGANPSCNIRADPGPTPRRVAGNTNVNVPNKRPTTAQPKNKQLFRGNNQRIDIQPLESQNNAEKQQQRQTIDYESQTAKLREEISKEFGITVNEKDIEQPWLSDITAIQDQLNENIYKSSIIDESPLNIMDQVSKRIIAETKAEDDPFANANKILDETFAKFGEYMNYEKELLDERIALLQQFGHEIVKHPASNFIADTEPDPYDDITQTPQPIIIQTKQRPNTARVFSK